MQQDRGKKKPGKGKTPPQAPPPVVIPDLMLIRLHKSYYANDIRAIRVVVRALSRSGNVKPHIQKVRICHEWDMNEEGGPGTSFVDVFINFAWRPGESVDASLYILGWGIDRPIVRFKNDEKLLELGEIIASDGSYGALGYVHNLPVLSSTNLQGSIQNLIKFLGLYAARGPNPPLDAAVTDSMARLVVTCSEALRFDAVMLGVQAILENDDPNTVFATPIIVREWGKNGFPLGPPPEE